MRLFFAAVVVMTVSFGAQAQTFDFKGVKLGAKATPEFIQDTLRINCGEGANKMTVCNGDVTIAEERGELNLVLSADGVVQRMWFDLDPKSFDVIAPELIKKFGKPSQRLTPTLQNSFGAKFRQEELVWNGKGGLQVRYSKFSSRIDRSMLYFSTLADRKLLNGESSSRSKDL